MTGFVVVRDWSTGPSFMTKGDGWTSKFENAVVFPTVEAAEKKLRGRPAEVKPVQEYVEP